MRDMLRGVEGGEARRFAEGEGLLGLGGVGLSLVDGAEGKHRLQAVFLLH
jgi:hypothetical protein